ncbi:MAG: amidohydrolase family protein [Cyclobacteriaceae bacterium]
MKKLLLILLAQSFAVLVHAQVPQPAKAQEQALLLKGGTIHVGNGQVIENGLIGFEKGRITLVEENNGENGDLSKFKVIEISGQHVYPGFILANSSLGLEEVSAIRAMNDFNETGDINPNVRSLVAYNTDSKLIAPTRYNGVLIAETTPKGGRIPGTSSVMNLEGWNWEDAVLKEDIAIHLNWPNKRKGNFDYSTNVVQKEENKDYQKEVDQLDLLLREAANYTQLDQKENNLKLEALQGLFNGEKALMLHTEDAKEIIESVRFFQGHGVKKIVLITGNDALDVSGFLSENSIPVILPPVHGLSDGADEDIYQRFKLPYLLTEAGVMVAISHAGMLGRARNLPFYAGSAVAHGLKKETALQLITLNPAKILGIDQEVGSLETGKRATLFVSKGDALDMMSNDLLHAFVNGKTIVLENEQQLLHQRYTNKYKE